LVEGDLPNFGHLVFGHADVEYVAQVEGVVVGRVIVPVDRDCGAVVGVDVEELEAVVASAEGHGGGSDAFEEPVYSVPVAGDRAVAGEVPDEVGGGRSTSGVPCSRIFLQVRSIGMTP
jgi:hypothetical protein